MKLCGIVERYRRMSAGFVTFALLTFFPDSALSQQTLVVDQTDPKGWVFNAKPDISQSGEAPILGISDHENGTGSLNFSTTTAPSSSRSVTLLQGDFPESLSSVKKLNDLESMSWYVHHSTSGKYPKIAIWAEWEDDDNLTQREALYFVPESFSVSPNQWFRIEVNLNKSKFRNNGATTDGKKETRTFATWRETVGDYRIQSIQISYNSPGIEYTSYVDYVEVNGTSFNFESALLPAPDAPTSLTATPGDSSVSVAFIPGDDYGYPISDYEYRIGDTEWVSAGTALSPIEVSDGLTNGEDYTLQLRAVSEAGEGAIGYVSFKPKAPTTAVTLEVNAENLRGFHLAGFSSDYVKGRDNTGIADDAGGSASLNAGLEGKGGDRWGLFLNPGDVAQRVITRLYDLESLSFRVWTDDKRNYPQLGFRMKRQTTVADVTWEQLNVKMSEAPDVTPGGWQTFTVDFDATIFMNADNAAAAGEEPSGKFNRTLNEWIRLYGDREISVFRWQTGNGRESIQTIQDTYIDYIEINGVTYDFEEVPLLSAPDAPVVSATPGDQSAQVSFSVPDDNGSPITDYQYQVGTEEWASAGTSSPFTITGLKNGRTVEIRMRAINAAGPGADSAPANVTPGGGPLPPTNLAATPGNGAALVSFNAAGTGNGRDIINYLVSTGGAFVALSPADSVSPVVVTGLTNGQATEIRLKTQTSLGLSAASAPVSVTPESGAAPPDAPTITGSTSGDETVSITFTPGGDNGAAITNYEYSLNGGDWTARSPASTASPLAIDGLDNGLTYMISLRAVNAEGAGANSDIHYFKLPLIQSVVTAPDGGSLQLEIEAQPGSTCGIDRNSLALVPAPALDGNVISAYPNMLDFTLVNCAPGESVEVAITLSRDPPENSIAYKYTNGVWSAIQGATLVNRVMRCTLQDGGPLDESPLAGTIEDPAAIAVPSGKPDAPYDLTAAPGIGSATISFTAGSDHGYEITNYLYSTDGVDYVPLNPPDAASPVTITGLTSGEGVSITLKAQNSKGDSPASEAVVVIPRAAPTPVPLPLWLLAAIIGSLGWLGYRRLRLA